MRASDGVVLASGTCGVAYAKAVLPTPPSARCRYAYAEGQGVAELSCRGEGDAFVLDISDWGKPFDVLSLPEPDTTGDLMHRPLGGLGVHLIRKVSNRVTYHREGDRNVLRLVFTRSARDQSSSIS